MIKVYKLLDETVSGLVSYGVIPPLELKYIPGETIYHNNMFVFDTLENAQEYRDNACIWEAETSAVKLPKPVILSMGIFKFFDAYWSGELDNIPNDQLMDTPHGTMLCDDLKLIREVE